MPGKSSNSSVYVPKLTTCCQLFGTWAETSKTREVDRSFKRYARPLQPRLRRLINAACSRLKTQSTYVRNEEDRLEERRQHCKVAPSYNVIVHIGQSRLTLSQMSRSSMPSKQLSPCSTTRKGTKAQSDYRSDGYANPLVRLHALARLISQDALSRLCSFSSQ